jgi:BolA protein
MQVRNAIAAKLSQGLAPDILDIEDQSHRHQGHAGANPQGESHFHVTIVSQAFEGKSAVARQRLVYGLLAEELASRVHALSLVTLTPAEADARKAQTGG